MLTATSFDFSIPVSIIVYLFLATWRLSNLLANEDGPFHFFKGLRFRIARLEVRSRRKNGLLSRLHLYEGVNCEYCNSMWFGIAFTAVYFFVGSVFLWLLLPLVISTGVILIKHVVFLLKSIDTRFDQQNQAHLAALKNQEKDDNPLLTAYSRPLFRESETLEERR